MPASHDLHGLLDSAIATITEQIDTLPDDAWHAQTPCPDWNAQQLVDHVTGTVHGMAAFIQGGDYRSSKAEIGPSSSAAEARERWHAEVERLRAVAEGIDPEVPLAGDDAPAWQSLKITTHDLTVHACDLAYTAGRRLDLPDELRDDLDVLVHETPTNLLRSPGVFGPEVEAPADASPTERVLAFLGRKLR